MISSTQKNQKNIDFSRFLTYSEKFIEIQITGI